MLNLNEHQERRPDYNEYIHSDHWNDLRLRAFARAGGGCEFCKAKGKLHGHHLRYRNLTDCTEDDIMALCETCHKIWHHTHSSHVVASRSQVLEFLEGNRAPTWMTPKRKQKSTKPSKKKKQRDAAWIAKHEAKIERRKLNKPLRSAWCRFIGEPLTAKTLDTFIVEVLTFRDQEFPKPH